LPLKFISLDLLRTNIVNETLKASWLAFRGHFMPFAWMKFVSHFKCIFMKRKKIDLGKKLFLAKETISALNGGQQIGIMGGGATEGVSACLACNTQPAVSCQIICQSAVCPTLPKVSCLQACFSVDGTPSVCQFC
jgi:hypothetical protein